MNTSSVLANAVLFVSHKRSARKSVCQIHGIHLKDNIYIHINAYSPHKISVSFLVISLREAVMG